MSSDTISSEPIGSHRHRSTVVSGRVPAPRWTVTSTSLRALTGVGRPRPSPFLPTLDVRAPRVCRTVVGLDPEGRTLGPPRGRSSRFGKGCVFQDTVGVPGPPSVRSTRPSQGCCEDDVGVFLKGEEFWGRSLGSVSRLPLVTTLFDVKRLIFSTSSRRLS